MEKYKVTEGQVSKISKLVSNIMNQVSLKDNCSINPEQIILTLEKVAKGDFENYFNSELIKLSKINSDEPFIITACLNSEFKSDLKNVFSHCKSSYRPDKFLSECCSTKPVDDTPEIEVDIKHIDALTPQYRLIIQTLSLPAKKLYLTQHQILKFWLVNEGWLMKKPISTGFVFLTKKNGRYKFVIFENIFSSYGRNFTEYVKTLDLKTKSYADFESLYVIIPKI